MSNYKYESYGVIRDLKSDIPYHTDDIVDLLEEKDQQITDLQSQLAITEKALDYAIFELDFARNHSQSTNAETLKRIDKLRNKILNKAKEMLENE